MELQANLTKAQKINAAPIISVLNQSESNPQIDSSHAKFLLRKNRERFNQHLKRLTELQQLIVAEEMIISDCLDEEKLLLATLEEKKDN